VRFYETGGPEVLRYEDADVGAPGPGEARVRHVAVGLNFADTYFRTGYYPVQPPCGIGVEASGVVEAVGEGVTHVKVGDRVAYTGSPLGAYSTERVMPAAFLVTLPDTIAFETAAAMMMRGLTSAYLLRRIAPSLKAGDTVLLHAAAGGVGLIFLQWARLLGIKVIGVVSTPEKARIATQHGAAHILMTDEDIAARVREITKGEGVSVAFDSVGKTTVMASLNSLKRRGLLVAFGTASGPIPLIDAMDLVTKGSLFVTRPALADYLADPADRAELAGELFGHVGAGRIGIDINQTYALSDAVRAHRDLEGRKTTGSSIFVI
jgi:NADPH2:quinone reductase